MIEIKGNMFEVMYNYDAICVTTNGVVKFNGDLVMGAGIAKQFAERWPELPSELGKWVKCQGNTPHAILKGNLMFGNVHVVSYPTKRHFKDKSDLNLIYHGALSIRVLAAKHEWNRVLLTRPGCGLGGRSWEHEVKPILEPLLDDRFVVIS